MDSPVRKQQKRNDYLRHKLFRKINRRKEAEKEQALKAPEKELKRRLRKPRYDDGKEELIDLPEVRVDKEGNVVNTDGRRGTLRLPEVTIRPDDTKDRLIKALGGNERAAHYIVRDMDDYKTEHEEYPDATQLPANYELNRLIELINDADNPAVYFRNGENLDEDKSYLKDIDWYRAHAISTPGYGNAFDRNFMVLGDPSIFSYERNQDVLGQYISELSHALQFRGGSFGNRWKNFKRRVVLEGNNDKPIHTKYGDYFNGYYAPNNTEYEAHKIINPAIWDYLRLGEEYDIDRFWSGINHDIEVSKRGRDKINPNALDYAPDSKKATANFQDRVQDIMVTPFQALDLLKWSDVTNTIKDILSAHFDKGKDSGIHIKPANRGKFNALKKRTGKTTEQLTHSKNPLTRKRAIFAQNAAKWHRK